jgi:hypothetical protein
MGKISVGLDKKNPLNYIIYIETNGGEQNIIFGVTNKEFNWFINSLVNQKKLCDKERKQLEKEESRKMK